MSKIKILFLLAISIMIVSCSSGTKTKQKEVQIIDQLLDNGQVQLYAAYAIVSVDSENKRLESNAKNFKLEYGRGAIHFDNKTWTPSKTKQFDIELRNLYLELNKLSKADFYEKLQKNCYDESELESEFSSGEITASEHYDIRRIQLLHSVLWLYLNDLRLSTPILDDKGDNYELYKIAETVFNHLIYVLIQKDISGNPHFSFSIDNPPRDY